MAPLPFPETVQPSQLQQAYDYRNSSRYWNIVCQSICLTTATILVLLRLWTKFFIVRAPGWEDCASAVSWFGMIAYSAISLDADRHGSGIHQSQVAPEDLKRYAQLANTSQIIYGPLIFVAKLSILLLYLRAFTPNRQGKTFYAIHFLLWFNLLFYTANTFAKIFQCTPRAKIWDPETPGRCVNVNLLIQTSAGLNVFSDFSLLLLPILSIWKLHMKTSQKIGISAVFAAGLFGCISSIVRLAIGIEKRATKDVTYDWFPEFLWTSAEITSAIITSCLPTLPNFFRHYCRKATTSSGSNRRQTTTDRHPYGRHQFCSNLSNHPIAPWYYQNPSDTNLLPQNFQMELEQAKPYLNSGAVITTEIRGGSRPGSSSSPMSISSVDILEEGEQQCPPSRKGILKTVQVETMAEERR